MFKNVGCDRAYRQKRTYLKASGVRDGNRERFADSRMNIFVAQKSGDEHFRLIYRRLIPNP